MFLWGKLDGAPQGWFWDGGGCGCGLGLFYGSGLGVGGVVLGGRLCVC